MKKILKILSTINTSRLIALVFYTFVIAKIVPWTKYFDFHHTIYIIFCTLSLILFLPTLVLIIVGLIKKEFKISLYLLAIEVPLLIFMFQWIAYYSV